MENLKISEKLFEDVIYYVLGSLDDEVKKEETPRRAVRVPAAVAALYLHCVCYVRVCVCLSAYARLYFVLVSVQLYTPRQQRRWENI